MAFQYRNESKTVIYKCKTFFFFLQTNEFTFCRTRSIRLIISELGSSFTLWDTIVNGASDVRLPKARHNIEIT